MQNWHRPLGANEKTARFLRNQHQDPIYKEDGSHRENVHESFPDRRGDIEYDEFWNKYDPHDPFVYYGSDKHGRVYWWDDHYERELYADSESIAVQRFKNWIDETATPSDIEIKVAEVIAHATTNDYSSIQTIAPAHNDYDQELLAISEFESYFKETEGHIFKKIRSATGDRENIRVINNQFPGLANTKIRYNLILFAPFWVRLPIHWDPKGKVSLVEHLFSIYRIPHFLIEEWFRSDIRYRKKWIVWSILLGQGVSLQKAAKTFNWKVPRKFSHYLFEISETMPPMLACIYAKVRCMGGDRRIFEYLILNDYFLMDPTEFRGTNKPHQFWLESVNWLINHIDELTQQACDRILHWAVHRFTESQYQEDTFTWKGRSVPQCQAHADEYYESIKQYNELRTWKAKGWNWNYQDEEGHSWKIQEITDSKALFEEGLYLRHCVFGYQGRCLSGYSAIFSLTKKDKRKVTIEIRPKDQRIVQVHGNSNRMAYPEEKEVIRKWVTYLDELTSARSLS